MITHKLKIKYIIHSHMLQLSKNFFVNVLTALFYTVKVFKILMSLLNTYIVYIILYYYYFNIT